MASNYNNPINILDSKNATGLGSGGSLNVEGGVSIRQDTFIGGSLSVSGTSTSFSDNIVIMNRNPTSTKDTGMLFERYSGDYTNEKKYSGLVYSETSDEFVFGYANSENSGTGITFGNYIPIRAHKLLLMSTENSFGLESGGSLTVLGGVSISKSLNVNDITTSSIYATNLISSTSYTGGSMNLSGDLIVGGSVVTVNITTTNVKDINISTGTLNVSNTAYITTATIPTLLNTNVVSTNISSGMLTLSTGLTSASAQITNANVTNLSVGTLALSNINIATATISSLLNTNVVSTNISSGTLDLSTGLTSANANVTTATIPTLLNTNVVSTNISSATLNLSTGLTSTNANVTTATIPTLLNTNVVSTNISSATLNVSSGLTSATAQITNANVTTATIPTLLNTNVVSTNISSATLNVSSGLTSTNANVTTATIPTLLNTNVVSTNISSATLNLSTGLTSTNVNVTNATIPTLLNTNVVSTNISSATLNVSSGLTSATAQITNANVTTATIPTLLNTNVVSTNISSATLNVSGGLISASANVTTATIPTLLNTNVVSTNISSATLNVSSAQITNLLNTNLSSATIILSNGLTAGNANITNLSSNTINSSLMAATTITGGDLSLSGNVNIGGTLTVVNITATNLMDTNLTAGVARITTNLAAVGNSNTIGNIFTTGGNVGIGTNTPNAALHVSGSETSANGGKASIYIQNIAPGSNNSWNLRAGATGTTTPVGGFSIADNVTYRMVFTSTGNVGIGLTNPSFTLDVNGTARVSNSITTGGVKVTGLGDVTNLNATTSTIETLLNTNSVSTNISSSTLNLLTGLTSASAQITNLNATTSTISTLLNTNQVSTNISSSTLNLLTGLTSASAQVTNLNATTSTISTLLNTNSVSTNISSSTLNLLTGLTSASAQVTNLNATTSTISTLLNTNSVSTNISSSTLNLSSGFTSVSAQITNLNATAATVATLLNTNQISTNITTSNMISTTITTGTLVLPNNTTGSGGLVFGSANSSRIYDDSQLRVYTDDHMYFYTSNTASSKMYINSSGSVGLGTEIPGEKLDVRGNLRVGGSTQGNYIAFYGTAGDSPGSYDHSYIGERVYGGGELSELLLFKGNDASFPSGPDRIRLSAAEISFDTHSGISGTFEGVGTSGTRRLTISNDGNVGINTTSPSFTLDVSGTARFTNSITTGALEVTGLTNTLNLTATNASIGTLTVSGGFGAPNAYVALYGLNVSTNITTGALYSTAQTTTNIVGTNISSASLNLSTGLTSASAQITNANVTTATVASLLNTNQISTNVSSATLNLSTGITAASAQITNSVSTNISSGTLNLSTGLTTASIQVTNANITTVTVGTSRLTSSLVAVGNSNTLGNIFTTGGNVGIGIINPTSKLHVEGVIQGSTGDGDKFMLTQFSNGSKISHSIGWGVNLYAGQSNAQTGFITLNTGSPSGHVERMRIVNNGNVGIGTTSPSFTLDVSGTARISSGITTGELEVTGLTDTLNLTATNVTLSNVIITNASSATLNLSTGLTTASIQVTNANMTTVTVGTLLNINSVSTNVSSSTLNLSTGLTSASVQVTNANATAATIATLLNTNQISTNVSSATLNLSTGLTSANLLVKASNVTTNIITNNENETASLFFGTPFSGLISNGLKAAVIVQGKNSFSRSRLHFCLDDTGINGTAYNASLNNSRMMIDSNGYVGIGTTSPSFTLEVNGTARFTSNINTNQTSTNIVATNASIGTLTVSGGFSASAATATLWGLNVSNNITTSALYSTNITSTNIVGTDISSGTIRVTSNLLAIGNSNTVGSIFTTGGNVGIGTTAPSYALQVVGDVYASGDVISFSDARYKTNIEPLADCLAKVQSISGISYTKLPSDMDQNVDTTKRHIGLLAQEVEQQFPELVYEDSVTGIKSVSYSNMVAVLLECVKSLSAKIADLKK